MPPRKKFKAKEKDEEVSDEEEYVQDEESEDDNEVKTPAKRGRGRPKKENAKKVKKPPDSDSGNDDDEYTPASKAAKKKIPKKKASSQEEETEDVEYKPKGTKSRGKPKKPAVQSLEGTDSGATPTLKKSSSNVTDVGEVEVDFSSSATTKDGKPWTMKFSSWNVNGIRAWLKNNGLEYVRKELPDVFCIQETKCSEEELPQDQLKVDGYESFWSSAEQKGYSGTGLFSKTKPLSVTYGIGVEEHDREGRVITAEFEKFYFVTSYVPNSGEKLKRLNYRIQKWDPAFRKYLKTLEDKKPVILCGDLNVAHHEIDLANPKGNLKTSGFTKEERESFSTLLEENNFVDSFRHLYPDKTAAYSYWSYRSNARVNNKGWRLDYFVISQRLVDSVCDHVIRSQVLGSDHCPIVLLLAL